MTTEIIAWKIACIVLCVVSIVAIIVLIYKEVKSGFTDLDVLNYAIIAVVCSKIAAIIAILLKPYW